MPAAPSPGISDPESLDSTEHAESAARLHDEETLERLAAIVESAEDAIFSTTLDGAITTWNRAAERLYGYRAEEVAGRHASLLCPPDRPDEIASLLDLLKRGERAGHHETVSVRGNGERIDVDLIISAMRGRRGDVTGASFIARNITKRKRAEQEILTLNAELHQLDTELRQITDAVPALISYIDTEHRYRVNNRAYEEWFNCSRTAIRGKHMREVLGEAAYQKARPYLEEALKGRKVSYEQELTYKEGLARYISATYTPQIGEDGRVQGVVALVSDVSDRKRLEDAQRLIAQVSSTLASAIDAGPALDKMARVLVPSLADACVIALRPTDRRKGTTVVVHRDPRKAERIHELLTQRPTGVGDALESFFARGGYAGALTTSVSEATLRAIARDEAHFAWLQSLRMRSTVRVPILAHGKELGSIVLVTTDESGRRFGRFDLGMAEEISRRTAIALENARLYSEVREAERRFSFLADASSVLAASLDCEATLANVARLAVPYLADWCTVHLMQSDGSIRRLALTHHDTAKLERAQSLSERPIDPNAPRGLPKVLRTGQPELYVDISDALLVETARDEEDLARLREAGLCSCIIVPLRAHEKIIGALSLVTTDSGRKYSEADLRFAEDLASRAALAVDNARLYTEAQEADRRKDDFLAILAHELRNPLAPIRNAVQVMREQGPGNPQIVRQEEIIERQAGQLARLLDDLLDVARITRGKLELRKEALDVGALMARAAEACQPLVQKRNLRFKVTLPGEPLRILADPARVEQILVNLLNNAAKYTEPGGDIELCAEAEGSDAVLRVRDTGVGIAKEMWARVFEPFVQERRSYSHAQGGLGLGLMLVRILCEMHGGSVSVHSEGPGKGSELTVRLPLVDPNAAESMRAEEEEEEGPPTVRPRAHRERRVLLVDDNVDAADTLAELVTLWGHSVRVAYDGPSAIEAALSEPPDVVLLDIGLPEMDGYEVARRLRQEVCAKGAFIAALTGYGQENDHRLSRESGFDKHLTKPVEPDALKKLLEEAPITKS